MSPATTWNVHVTSAFGRLVVAVMVVGCTASTEGGEVDSPIRGPLRAPAADCLFVEATGWQASRFAGDQDLATFVSPATSAPFVAATLELSVLGDASVGTFDLASERDFTTCVHCLTAYGGPEEERVFFFQTQGSLVLEAVDLETGAGTGMLADVKLVEGTLAGSPLAFVPKPGGRCLALAKSAVQVDPPGE